MLFTSALMFESKTLWAELSSLSNWLSRLNKLSANFRTQYITASEAVLTEIIENISGTRLSLVHNSATSLWFALMATKQDNSELGFSLLAASCLNLSISGFTEEKNLSHKSELNSWSSYLLRTRETIFRQRDLISLSCFKVLPLCTNKLKKRRIK